MLRYLAPVTLATALLLLAAVPAHADEIVFIQPPLVAPVVSPNAAPPLPFERPQVGPPLHLLNRDVELRTTAFLPTAAEAAFDFEPPTTSERWIRVDLGEQHAVAYEGLQPVRAFVISSGLPRTSTIQGTFRITTKVPKQTLSGNYGGSSYRLPGVKWVQYFHGDFAFHGTYWHNNFGTPMSHGCINMTNRDAKWLFDWAGPTWDGHSAWYHAPANELGTLVVVHE